MRRNFVTLLLVALLGALAFGLFARERTAHDAPLPAAPSASVSASASAAAPSAAPSVVTPPGATSAAPPKGPALGRTLRVTGLGWDLLAPALVENGGTKASKQGGFGAAGLEVSVQPMDAIEEVERALARGGGDDAGADVALMPLPELVASYDKLRALDLRVFFVSGWSRGRELLTGKSLTSLPAKGSVELRAPGPASATFVALFALDVAGVPPARINLVDDAKAPLSAVSRDPEKAAGVQQQVLVSTAEASRLVPYVAVAPGGLVQSQRPALLAFVKGWLAGQDKLAKDAPAAARTIAALEGAPEPISLLAWLGEIESASLLDNAEAFGLSGRGALTLDLLLARAFALWRDAKLTSNPPPPRLPVDGSVVATLVRAEPKLAKKDDGAGAKKPEGKPRVVLVQRLEKLDEDAVAEALGLLAAAFPRSEIALTLHRGPTKETDALLERTALRYGLDDARLLRGKAKPAPGAQVSIEVFAVR